MSQSARLAESLQSTVLLLTNSSDGCGAVRHALQEAGLPVAQSGLRTGALVEALEAAPFAVILDARHHVELAAELCASLRAVENLRAVRVVAITPRKNSESQLRMYEAGADDCWTFTGDSLQLLRRAGDLAGPALKREAPQVLRCGTIALYPERYTATCSGRTVQLTALQLKLLAHFMRSPGVVFSYRQLLEDVWCNPDGDERMVRSGIVRLRRALNPGAGSTALIKTIRGGGYAFDGSCEDGSRRPD